MIRAGRKGTSRAAQEATTLPHGTIVRSDIPARLDALPWSAWHWRVVIALGVSWGRWQRAELAEPRDLVVTPQGGGSGSSMKQTSLPTPDRALAPTTPPGRKA